MATLFHKKMAFDREDCDPDTRLVKARSSYLGAALASKVSIQAACPQISLLAGPLVLTPDHIIPIYRMARALGLLKEVRTWEPVPRHPSTVIIANIVATIKAADKTLPAAFADAAGMMYYQLTRHGWTTHARRQLAASNLASTCRSQITNPEVVPAALPAIEAKRVWMAITHIINNPLTLNFIYAKR